MSSGQESGMPHAEALFEGDGAGVISPNPMQVAFPSNTTNLYNSGSAGNNVPLGFPPGFNVNEHDSDLSVKKRGRPRKIVESVDGNVSLGMMPNAGNGIVTGAGSVLGSTAFSGVGASSFKKPRGRPRGSTNKVNKEGGDGKQDFQDFQPQDLQPHQLVSAGSGFAPYVISVKAGEDVSSEILSFAQNGPRAVCVMSAIGAISCVSLRRADTSGGTTTYEGRFDIISLHGSYQLAEVAGMRTRNGVLTVVLSGPNGSILCGSVAGLLTAASPVQVVVGSFFADGLKETKAPPKHMDSAPIPFSPSMMSMPMSMQPGVFSAPGAGSTPIAHGVSVDESSGGEGINPPGGTASNHNNGNPQGIFVPWR